MKWIRRENGVYVIGAYRVVRQYLAAPDKLWHAKGPGVDQFYPTKVAAQDTCHVHILRRIDENDDPVRDDFVRVLADGRRGQVRTIMHTDNGPLWCLLMGRGKRLCLRRDEIEVAVP